MNHSIDHYDNEKIIIYMKKNSNINSFENNNNIAIKNNKKEISNKILKIKNINIFFFL